MCCVKYKVVAGEMFWLEGVRRVLSIQTQTGPGGESLDQSHPHYTHRDTRHDQVGQQEEVGVLPEQILQELES